MSSVSGAAGRAALAICESMLLSLTESKIIDQAEARAILADAAAAHRNSIPLLTDGGAAAHEQAATLIETILKGGNSVRHA
jgi:predicted metal-dependent phosphotriesterase family hydrolase